MSNNIEGKIVVITGASSWLGEATARFLSSPGATVVLGARRADRILSLADGLTASGGKAIAISMGVTHCDQAQEIDRRRGPEIRADRCDDQQRRPDAAGAA